MKTRLTIFSLLIYLVATFIDTPLKAQVSHEYVSNWYNNKKAAATITFDGIDEGQLNYALPVLDSLGFKASFFLNTKNTNWINAKIFDTKGHEVGARSIDSEHLRTLTADQLEINFQTIKNEFAQNLPNQRCLSRSWPFGEGGGSQEKDILIRNIASKYFATSRNASVGSSGFDPYNAYLNTWYNNYFLQVGAMFMDNNVTSSTFRNKFYNCIDAGGRFTLMYHAIEVSGYAPVSLDSFKVQMNELNLKKDSVWIAPMLPVSLYQKEKISSELKILKNDVSPYQVQVTDTLPDSVYNHPLTINFKLAANETVTGITIKNQTISFAQWGDYYTFNAVPSSDTIQIHTSLLSNSAKNKINVSYFYVLKDELIFTNLRSEIAFEIYDLQARLVLKSTTNEHKINLQNIPNGIYIIKTETQGETHRGRFVK